MTEAPPPIADAPRSVASPAPAGIISVIVPNFDGAHFLGPCLDSLFGQEIAASQLDVVVVDNGSRDGSLELIRAGFPGVRVISNPRNVGFTPAINQGLNAARGEWILLLNNDTVLEPGALPALLDHLRHAGENVGGVQPLLLWAKDRDIVDSAGIVLGKRFTAHDHLHGKPVARAPVAPAATWGICFACALIRREVFNRAGVLDHDFYAEWDDVDFATRARWMGYSFLLVPHARVLHHRSPTSRRDSTAKFIRLRRNRVLTFLKCLPRGMALSLLLHRVQHDFGMLIHYWRRRQLSAVARSWVEVAKLAPRMLSRRRSLRRHRTLTDREMSAAIREATRFG